MRRVIGAVILCILLMTACSGKPDISRSSSPSSGTEPSNHSSAYVKAAAIFERICTEMLGKPYAQLTEADFSRVKAFNFATLSYKLDDLRVTDAELADTTGSLGMESWPAVTSISPADLATFQAGGLSVIRQFQFLQWLQCGTYLKLSADEQSAVNFPYLKYLSASDSKFASLAFLIKSEDLLYLNLATSTVTDLSPLRSHKKLRVLLLRGSRIRDVSGLTGSTGLVELHLENNQIQNISSLADCKLLQKLVLQNNQVTDLSPLSGCRELRSLDVSTNRLLSIAPITSLPVLEQLDASDNQLTDLEGIKSLPASLKYLGLSRNKLRDISWLGDLAKRLGNTSSLNTLYLMENQISDISPVGGFSKLKGLYFAYNRVENLNGLQSLPSLEYMEAYDNFMQDISPIADFPTTIQYLDLRGNRIEDVSPLGRLAPRLAADGNSGEAHLGALYLSRNRIRSIGALAKFKSIGALDLSDNIVADISPLSGVKMESIYLANNPLTGIEALHIQKDASGNIQNYDTVDLEGTKFTSQSYIPGG